ncbi:YfiR family protein [Photobacterium chitinilyticum]|uniref:YfiR family protein n=1 Tax=Photobacterium chitinilyticum TaxID=2485123 RepID=UPI003D133FBC
MVCKKRSSVSWPSTASNLDILISILWRLSLGLSLVACQLFSPYSLADTDAQNNGHYSEHQVKAIYLYHFANFVHWPDPAPKSIRYCTFGNDTVTLILKQILYKKSQPNRSTSVTTIVSLNQARGNCEVLYITKSKLQTLQTIPQLSGVLTVSDSQHFLQHGGMIELRSVNSQIKPAIALNNVTKGQLTISSRLLRVALPPTDLKGRRK